MFAPLFQMPLLPGWTCHILLHLFLCMFTLQYFYYCSERCHIVRNSLLCSIWWPLAALCCLFQRFSMLTIWFNSFFGLLLTSSWTAFILDVNRKQKKTVQSDRQQAGTLPTFPVTHSKRTVQQSVSDRLPSANKLPRIFAKTNRFKKTLSFAIL